jgi:hypothetical protein
LFVPEHSETSRVETLEPGSHSDDGEPELVRKSRYTAPWIGQEKDASAFDQPGCRST